MTWTTFPHYWPGYRWIRLTKGKKCDLWYSLYCKLEKSVEQSVVLPAIRDATSLMLCHCKAMFTFCCTVFYCHYLLFLVDSRTRFLYLCVKIVSLVWWILLLIPSACDMMTSSNGNIFRVIGHLCGEFTVHWSIPRTKASDAELWCFLWCLE